MGEQMDIDKIRKLFNDSQIRWSAHGLMRMQERDISRDDIKKCIFEGEIIEDYPEDYPYPSCLVFGHDEKNKVLHVVVGTDDTIVYVITAYYPNADKFEKDLKTRKE